MQYNCFFFAVIITISYYSHIFHIENSAHFQQIHYSNQLFSCSLFCITKIQSTEICYSILYGPLKYKGTSPPNSTSYKMVPVLLFIHPSLVFPFHLWPYPIHPAGYSFCIIFFLVIFILLSPNNSNKHMLLPHSIGKFLTTIFFW